MTQNLFEPTRHEAITRTTWDINRVKSEIKTIIQDIEASKLTNACWPTHNLDAESYRDPSPKWALYAGSAGVVLAMKILKDYEYTTTNYSHLISHIHASYMNNPDVRVEPGLQLGELGILMPAMLAQPNCKIIEKKLIQAMEKTLPLPLYEITSGQSGMMHAALALYRKTQKNCWKALYIQGAQSLIDNWQKIEDQWLWQSQVFGPKRHYYGACHGVAGNANILLQGIDLLPKVKKDMIIDRVVSTLLDSVKKNEHGSNWELCTKPTINKRLVQWCHGAAGIVTAIAKTPGDNTLNTKLLDELLDSTGELIWQAGPLVKGSNICHGTAGNGYAFLYLYQRTGHISWLNRARTFAMHAIEQCQNDRAKYGQGRYTLWTGDAGLAIFLHHCIHPELANIPGLDLF